MIKLFDDLINARDKLPRLVARAFRARRVRLHRRQTVEFHFILSRIFFELHD